MKNIIYYIYLKNINQSRSVQKRLFKMGYRWRSGENKKPFDYTNIYIVIDNEVKKLSCIYNYKNLPRHSVEYNFKNYILELG